MEKVLIIANEDTHLYYFHMNDIKLLEGLGYEVEIAALRGTYTGAVEGGKRIYHNIHFSRNPLGISNIAAFFELLRLFNKNKYKMIHVHNVVASVITRLAARFSGVKNIVYTAHGFPFHPEGNRFKNLIFKLIEKIMGYFTDYLIVMNDWDFKMALKNRIVNTKNIFRTNGVGVDLSRFNRACKYDGGEYKRAYGIKDNVKVISCVAEIIPRKNQKMVVESAADIIKKQRDTIFLFVGDMSYNKGYYNMLKKLIDDTGLKDHIIFTGRVDDVPGILNITDVLVLTSVYEGLPRAIQEGMAMGLQVVASDIRGNSDLIAEGINGYLVKLGDTKDLTDKVLKLLTDDRLRKEVGENNKKKIEKEYSLKKVEKQMKDIYTVVLGRKRHFFCPEDRLM
jgi:glycosyltransferase involved in cell wall biosynthesis